MRCAPGAARPASMRSAGRLLPALQAAARGGRAAASAAAAQVRAQRAAAASAAADPALQKSLTYLRQGVEYELRYNCCNVQGATKAFDRFLADNLAALSSQLPLAAAYMEQARRYAGMSPERRTQLCQELLDGIASLEASGSSSVMQAPGSARLAAAVDTSVAAAASPAAPAGAPGAAIAATSKPPSLIQAAPGPLVSDAAQQQQEAALPPEQPPRASQAAAHPKSPTAEPAMLQGEQQAVAQAASPPRQATAAAWPAPAARAEPPGMEEWALTYAEQCERPFARPDASALLCPVPVVFDLETSGTSAASNSIVEVAAMQLATGASLALRVRLPASESMHPGATEATGITTEDARLEVHPEFEQVYIELFSLLRNEVAAAGPGAYLLLIGHNIRAFDLPIMVRHASRAALPTLRHARFLDTLVLSRHLLPDTGGRGEPDNRKLSTLYEFFSGAPPEEAHRALSDCRSNALVLQALLDRLPGLPAGPSLERLHAAATMPDVNWVGWVDDIPPAGQRPAAKAPRRRTTKPGDSVSVLDSLAAAAAGGGAAAASGALAPGAPSALDEIVAAWAAPDPVARAESGGAAALEGGESGAELPVLTVEEKRAQVAAVQAGWQAIVQDPGLRSSFLSTPISKLVKRGTGFTPKQAEDLESGKVGTLGQLLECYPSRLLTSRPGRLPEEGDVDPVVTLAVRLRKTPTLRTASTGAYMLRADMQVVHPSEAGLDVPWLPPDAYADRQCTLELFSYRHGKYAAFALRQQKAKLEAAGPVFVVSSPVTLKAQGDFSGPDTWSLDPLKLRVLLPEEARAAFSRPEGAAQLSVVHPSRGDVTSPQMTGLVEKALRIAQDAADRGEPLEPLPDWVLQSYELPPLLPALRSMHKPGSEGELEAARQRLAFQELLALQLKLLVQRNLAWGGLAESGGGGAVRVDGRSSQLLDLAKESLGFDLTEGQQSALDNILGQMADWPPMQCLLQGDVGCGKTAVAFLALLASAGAGYQGAIMAPTEILAEQHYRGLQALVQRMNRQATRQRLGGFQLPRIALLTGSVKGKARTVLNAALARGDIEIAVGTHALISDSTQFARLGLAVVDEQHKFGVEQRGRLLAKASPAPHVLHMTATPIPRTQALIDHGDMTQVVIQQLPAGRTAVRTRALEDGSAERERMYEHIRAEMALGHCIYIVCPFVDESEKVEEVKAATAEADRLVAEGHFESGDLGLLHGQMSPEEKEVALQKFKAGHTKVLVSTTVVEVGVDVPQATVMVIEHAERFGFAQLHQLRGRVGRSERQSYCYLVYSKGSGATARKKMRVLENCSNGFAVAECDLELRGAGEVLGKRQSGRNVRSTFKAARVPGDRELLEQAREAASRLLAADPDPRSWPAGLRALVADEGLLQLDTLSLPSLA
ncbi:hypothetical protein ABPG75_008155 [Micractinium tetrahymenae]